MFIGQFGQDEEWDIYKTHQFDSKRKRNDVKVKNYGTFKKNEELEKILRGEYVEADKDSDDGDDYEGQENYKKGYTVANASSMFGYDASKDHGLDKKPKKVKSINEDKYFNAITSMKPMYRLKLEDDNKFFKEMVGVDRQHFEKLIGQLKQI